MARTFNGTSDKVTFGSESAVDDIAPFTAVALIRPTANITDERQILTKMDASWSGSMYLTAYAAGGGNNKVVVVRSGSAPLFTETAADVIVPSVWNVLVSTWNGVGVSGLANVYTCQLGGVITETSYTSRTGISGAISDASPNIMVGARISDATFFAGGIAECAIWNRVLTDGEIRALGRGFAPAFFPRGRVFYSLIDGRHSPEINMAGTTHGTVTGTTFLDHPPVIYPRQMGVQVPTVGGSSFKAAWARGANVVIGSGAR